MSTRMAPETIQRGRFVTGLTYHAHLLSLGVSELKTAGNFDQGKCSHWKQR